MKNKAGLALVTGSSSGIGKAIALRLAKDGYFVLVHYHRDHEGALDTYQKIHEQGGQAKVLQFNVSDSAQIESSLDQFLKSIEGSEKLPFSVLVNNAGVHSDSLLGLMSDSAFDQVIQTNVHGPFYLMRWAVKKMLRQRFGSIVNIASIAGQTGNIGQINYAASKAALIAMTKTLSMEIGSRGIRVNAVAPGLIETQMISDVPMLDEMKKRIPLGRIGAPEDVAGAVSFLCSNDANYITGHTLSVNGGLFPS